jgi:polar amino acid transport system permease protein
VNYIFQFSVVTENLDLFAWGALRTIAFSFLAMVFGLSVGIFCAYVRTQTRGLWAWPVVAYVELFRNTPFLIQLFFFFFALPAIGLKLTPNQAAILALTINLGAYTTEIVRAGVEAIHPGQIEAGSALGLTHRQVFTHVVLMPALERVYPALSSQFIFLMLGSAVVSVISAQDLTATAALLESRTYRAFEIYFFTTFVYIALAFLFRGIFLLLGKFVFSGRLSYQAG